MPTKTEKICPLLSTSEKLTPCVHNCAWYNESTHKCSMSTFPQIKHTLEKVNDSIDNIYNLLGMTK